MNPALDAPHFHSEKAAWAYVEALLWPDGPVCPHCGETGRVGVLTGKTTRFGLRKCYACRQPFTCKVGTVFEHSHAPLRKWLQAIHLIASSKKGISSNQLSRMLGVTVKTGWFMSHRIREAMKAGGLAMFGVGGGIVEADESFYGLNPAYPPKPGHVVNLPNKNALLSLVDRDTGEARSFAIDRARLATVAPVLAANVSPNAHLVTDQAHHYAKLSANLQSHTALNHTQGDYGRGMIHTNSVDGLISTFKRGMHGTYQHCDARHVGRYMTEFTFRYSHRVKLGVDDTMRASRIVAGALGRRLSFKTLTAPALEQA